MGLNQTNQKLSTITDEGLFELLATAILREDNPIYGSLIHTGVNELGKTIKSPLDGISFVGDSEPPHMISVHHTISMLKDLENKWLHDPANVKPRKGTKPTAVPGDLIKTSKIIEQERKKYPDLIATLVLTTNKEPKESLIRKVHDAGIKRKIAIDIWSCSRLCHYLDNNPTGQWLRYSYLRIEQELLSPSLLYILSKKSIEIYRLPGDPKAWVKRELDYVLENNLLYDITFLNGRTGLGKTVACYKRLKTHIDNGGFGLVLSHETIIDAPTLEQAIYLTLKKLHPHLSDLSQSALSFYSKTPILLMIEDINRSGRTQFLIEKIISWSNYSKTNEKKSYSNWKLLCPIWPKNLLALRDNLQNKINDLVITIDDFNESEGCNAVLLRSQLNGDNISMLKAKSISQSLGHDLLLIALYESNNLSALENIIDQFIEKALSRVASENNDYTASDYRNVLSKLTKEMLLRKEMELTWQKITSWECLTDKSLHLISHLANQGEIIRIAGPSTEQKILFRHDRILMNLFSNTINELIQQNNEQMLDVITDPYFAEYIGVIISSREVNEKILKSISIYNPLSLFYALKHFGEPTNQHHYKIINQIHNWLDVPKTHSRANLHLRIESLNVLSETDYSKVLEITQKYKDNTISKMLAIFRNGNLNGGIDLCYNIAPGSGAPWRDLQIEHAKIRYGDNLIKALNNLFNNTDLNKAIRIGALRLSGHLEEPKLGTGIKTCWESDKTRNDYIEEYLWAFGKCCGNKPEYYLKPVCDAWSQISDIPEKEGYISKRLEVVEYLLKWAFQKWPPLDAIDYFIERGKSEELRWPLTILLHGIDHPKAIHFVIKELAKMRKEYEENGSMSHFLMRAHDDWRRTQEDFGHPMSDNSRSYLLKLWQDVKNDKYIRIQAFIFWAATMYQKDINILKKYKSSEELTDYILKERLIRKDKQAIPSFIDKLLKDWFGNWWYCGRYIWSPELTKTLDKYLAARKDKIEQKWGKSVNTDYYISEILMVLPINESEQILLKHWYHLHFSSYFVQAALYIGTPSLLDIVNKTVKMCPKPEKLFEHIPMHFGIRVKGRMGITRKDQIQTLAPYLHLIDPFDIQQLWEDCNKKGWYFIRKKLLDKYLKPPWDKELWNRKKAFLYFDELTDERHLIRLERWISDMIQSDISWEEILCTLKGWYYKKRSILALKVIITAITLKGTRKDLKILKVFNGMPRILSNQIIEDAIFYVQRRSLN